MHIDKIELTNWRSFSSKKINFDSKLTAIVGKNGVGKSNILEAVAMLSGIRPSRVETDVDLIRFGEVSAKITGTVVKDKESVDLVINLQLADSKRVAKSFFIDSFKKRLFDFVDVFSVVVFEPTDLDLVSGSPSLRRKHLDRFLSSLDAKYWRAISAYGKIVTRRNKVLLRIRDGKAKEMELGFWDERLVDYAKFISGIRKDFFEYLNFVEHGETLGKIGDLSWELKQSLVSEEKLKSNRERDIAAGVTLSGPHRDDFRFIMSDSEYQINPASKLGESIFKKKDLEFFGSRGEQRMAVLALKLAELEYHKVKRGERPVLALDDIFSELDWEHRETVLSVIGNQQTIITAAEKESIPKEIFKKAKIEEI